jgi:dihydrodipicolinate synthase/N-acetylneuraminate lyase
MVQHGTNEANDRSDVAQQRARRIAELFPDGVPRLWCPTLTHFRAAGEPDETRIGKHLGHIAPYARGILVPGSTGEGWEMNDDDIRRLLAIVLRSDGVRVLVGVLKHTLDDMLRCIDDTVKWLVSQTDAASIDEALARSGVVGFTVCPPRGEHLSQAEIENSLSEVLERGLATALYQLPQVTGNEMSPETVASLAARFPNFLLFKDTSGSDRVARSGLDFGGVFLVRGAEGGYARWTRAGTGPYDGLLLSTANVFAPQYARLLALLDAGQADEADELSQRIETVVQQTFALVADFPAGNAFTNANKVLDHRMAYGPAAGDRQPPLLYRGVRLPAEYIERAEDFLRAADLLPDLGYAMA